MWQIEIRDNAEGEIPGKLRSSDIAKLPSVDKLVRQDRFAIMTRIQPESKGLCSACKRRKDMANYVNRTKELRETYGPKVVAFPTFLKEISTT